MRLRLSESSGFSGRCTLGGRLKLACRKQESWDQHREGILERIEGSYNNVTGLPTERLRATLERIGLLPGPS